MIASGEPHTTPSPDAVGWLTIYCIVLLAVPTRFVIAPLGSAGAPSMIFGLLSLLLWFGFQLSRSRSAAFQVQPVRLAMTVFILSICVSYVAAMARPIGADEISPADVALLAAASWTGTLLVAHDGIADRDRFGVLIHRLGVAGGLMAALGIAQFALGDTLVDHISIPGLASGLAGGFERQGFTRPSGTATHPIEFGVLLTMLLPLALHIGIYRRGRPALTSWLPTIAIIAVLPLSLSRSALLSGLVCLLVLLPTWPASRRWVVIAGVVVGGAILAISVPGLSGTIRGLFVSVDEDPSVQSRTDSYDLAVEFIENSPIFGRGLGTFLPKYWILDNQYLLMLITIGVVGVLAFLGVLVTAIWRLVKLRAHISDPATRDLAQSLIASIIAGGVGLAFFDAFAFPMTAGTLFMIVGLAGGLTRLYRSEPPALRHGPGRRTRFGRARQQPLDNDVDRSLPVQVDRPSDR